MNRPVEAVVFDWGGTLTPWHTIDLAEQWRVYARTHAAHAHEAEDVAARILAAEATAWRRTREDGGSARIAEILAEAGVDTEHGGHVAARSAYEEFWEPHTLLDPHVPSVWQGLRDRGVRVGVLSNTIWTRDYHERVFARDGVLDLVDGAVYSSEIDHAKPHPRAFEAALAAVGVDDPSRAVYVGDRPFEDVHGAQRVGMRAVWVPHSDIPVDQQVAVDVTPDAVVQKLTDLLDVVDTWLATA
ncbi:MAG TPA: HAD family hydrolase [Actinomycetales bacterium]|nr:HAD family hydrolase [Actinomycetales bacterium]